VNMWSVYFDMEKGESDNVFTRVDNYDYTNFRVRSLFKPTRQWAFNLTMVTKDNTNPSLTRETVPRAFGSDVNSRTFSASADYTPNGKVSLSSGYTKMNLTSQSAVIFFFNSVKQEGTSRYFLKDNFFYVNLFAELHPRVSVYGTYRIHNDPGQQDRKSTANNVLLSSYPYQNQAPEARATFKLHERVDWVVGYQYFDYKEEFFNSQWYKAHLPYTSLRFYLGGGRSK